MKRFLHILERVADVILDQVNSAPRFLFEDCRKSHFCSIQDADLRQDADGQNHHPRRGGARCFMLLALTQGTHMVIPSICDLFLGRQTRTSDTIDNVKAKIQDKGLQHSECNWHYFSVGP